MGLVIRNTKTDKPGFLRIGVYGNTGVGKTSFSATFPNPFYFSVGAESGVSSLTVLDKNIAYVLIESRSQMEDALQMFKRDYKSQGWKTAIVDTATIYGRFVSMEESRHGDITMDQAKWMKVLGHLLNIRDVLHTCECHVVWIFHVDEKKSGEFILSLEPKLVGQARNEIVQTLGLLAYMDREELDAKKDEEGKILEAAKTIRRLWVRCPKEFSPRFAFKSWYESVLTEFCYAPDFRVLAKYLAPKHIQSLLEEEKVK